MKKALKVFLSVLSVAAAVGYVLVCIIAIRRAKNSLLYPVIVLYDLKKLIAKYLLVLLSAGVLCALAYLIKQRFLKAFIAVVQLLFCVCLSAAALMTAEITPFYNSFTDSLDDYLVTDREFSASVFPEKEELIGLKRAIYFYYYDTAYYTGLWSCGYNLDLLTEYADETDFNDKAEELMLRCKDEEIREEGGVIRITLDYFYDEANGERIYEVVIDRANLRIVYRNDYGPGNFDRFGEYLKEKGCL